MTIAAMVMTGMVAGASGQVKLPPYTQKSLPNGVVIQLLEKSDVPMITLTVAVRGGAETDPPGKAGLASVTAECLRRGTTLRTAAEFSAQLDALGAGFTAGVDEQSTLLVAEFLAKDLDRALALVADVVRDPVFPEAELNKVIEQRVDAIRAVKDNPSAMIGRYFREFFYPKAHPYSRQITGDEITLPSLTRDDLARYHRRFYTGRNLVVTAVGTFDAGPMADKLAAAFGDVAAGERYEWIAAVPDLAAPSPRLLLVDKPDSTQTFFAIGLPGIYRRHPDRVAMILINTLFGGRFSSMLNDELRVNSGLTYGAFSDLALERLPGAISISSYTETDTTTAAIDLTLGILRRLNEHGVTADQLASAKAYVKGRFPTANLETSTQLAAILSAMAIFELDRDEIDNYFARIDAVTLEQANAAARKHYRSEGLRFVLVGDAAKIREAAAAYARDITVIPVDKPGFRAD